MSKRCLNEKKKKCNLSTGPAGKSWSFRHNIFITMFRNTFDSFKYLTLEQIQLMTTNPDPIIPAIITHRPFTVPLQHRERADAIVSSQFSRSDREKLDWNLKVSCKELPDLRGEWLQHKDVSSDNTLLFFHGGAYFFGSYKTYRPFLYKIVEQSMKQTCAIDYRLSPQYPFPSALEDAMAAYLYLIDPPKGIAPIDPKKIVLSGDSSGGGLAISLLIAIRDAGLPQPGSAVVFSPLLDLTYSLPSVVENISMDFLPPMGHWHAPSPASTFIHDLEINKYSQDSSDMTKGDNIKNDFNRIHYYVPNVGLKLALVSPVFDKKCLSGLPNILIQCGGGERLRDESIYAALLGTGQFNDTLSPSPIRLEIYEDQPHDFQFLVDNRSSKRAIQNAVDFFVNLPSDDGLVMSKMMPDGTATDIKDTFLASFTRAKWDEWRGMLEKTSVKDRFDYIDYYCKLILNG
ncbi:alpha/beta-hydrolase [Backusella circina FSU 941]|nr:alpha/beta-hydrolase [Backusella circina FSU 941]